MEMRKKWRESVLHVFEKMGKNEIICGYIGKDYEEIELWN